MTDRPEYLTDEQIHVYTDDIEWATSDPMMFSLRAVAESLRQTRNYKVSGKVMDQAADEIERLRDHITALEAEVQANRKLRATCQTCDGSGIAPFEQAREGHHLTPCQTCDGDGRLTVEATIKLLVDLLRRVNDVDNWTHDGAFMFHDELLAVLTSLPKEEQ